MLIRCFLVLHYLLFSCRFLTIPWRYFQLNADYFNPDKKIFSKQDLDNITPPEWRLSQYIDNPNIQPVLYPVFAKPEWGQNSSGVNCIYNQKQLNELRNSESYQHQNYLIQEAATGEIEFEIFIVKDPIDQNNYSVMSITQVKNISKDKYPINGIYNKETSYEDITRQLTLAEKTALWIELSRMGNFNIARYSLKSDSLTKLLNFEFKLVEVNLYLPMPLSLLSKSLTVLEKYKLIYKTTYNLAILAQKINNKNNLQNIFFNKLFASYRGNRRKRGKNVHESNKKNDLQVDQ